MDYSSTPQLHTKVGCEILIERMIDGKRYLLMGKKNMFGAGTYGFPGGTLEYGEKLIQAAMRELEEETGIKAREDELELVGITDDAGDIPQFIHATFLLKRKIEGSEIQNMEPECCEGWEFLDCDNLPDNLFLPQKRVPDAYVSGTFYFFRRE